MVNEHIQLQTQQNNSSPIAEIPSHSIDAVSGDGTEPEAADGTGDVAIAAQETRHAVQDLRTVERDHLAFTEPVDTGETVEV